MAIIQDGGGKNPALQTDPDGRARVESKSNDRSFFISEEQGQAYVLVSTDNSISVGDYLAYWQNTSTDKNLHILDVTVNVASSGGEFQIATVTGTADGGSVITPSNLNRTSNNDAEATARGHGAIGQLTEEAIYYYNRLPGDGHHDENFFGSLILGQNDAVAVRFTEGLATSAHVVIFGYYD